MARKVWVIGLMLVLGLVGFNVHEVAAYAGGGMDIYPLNVAAEGTPFAVHVYISGLTAGNYWVKGYFMPASGSNYWGKEWSFSNNIWFTADAASWNDTLPKFTADGSGVIQGYIYLKNDPTDSGYGGPRSYRLRIVIRREGTTNNDNPASPPYVTIMNMTSGTGNGGWFHNDTATGYAGSSLVRVLDGSNLAGFVLTEPNGVDDDNNGTVDDENYGPSGNTGDFRVAVPSGMNLNVTIDGTAFANNESVTAGQDKGIPSSAPTITVSAPTIAFDDVIRRLDITNVTATCSIHGALTNVNPAPSGPSIHSYTVFVSGGAATSITGPLTYSGGTWSATGVDVSSLGPGEYNVRATFTDLDATGTSPASSNFRILHTIAQAKALGNGSMVTVRGIVTAPKGIFSNSEMYIQDATAGIRIYRNGGIPVSGLLGDLVEITGTMATYQNEREIDATSGTITTISSGNPVPAPTILSTAASMLEANEGLLVQVSSATVTASGTGQFDMDDGSGPAHVYIDYSTGINLASYPGFGVGAVVRVIGVAGQYYSTHELKPRFVTDIVVLVPAPVPSPSKAATIMKNMSYAATNNIGKAAQLMSEAEVLLQQAQEKGLDTSVCELMISEAEEYLSMAREVLAGNSIAANNFALKAIALFEEAIECLKALLGL